MNPVALLAAFVLIMCALVGVFGDGRPDWQGEASDTAIASFERERVFTDPLTGCQYVTPVGGSGVTARLDPTGKPLCGITKHPDNSNQPIEDNHE